MSSEKYDIVVENIDLSKYGSEYSVMSKYQFDNRATMLVETKFSDLDALDGVLKLQTSISGKSGTFVDVLNNSVTLDVTSGVQYIENIIFTGRFLRIVFVKNSVTSGTLDHIYIMSKNYS